MKNFTKEHKENISKAKKGSQLTEEHKKNIAQSMIGKVLSVEHKQNISKSALGASNPKAILNEDQVKEIKLLIFQGKKNTVIAKMFDVGAKLISDIKNNKTWTHIKI
jgi:hypothetical protein